MPPMSTLFQRLLRLFRWSRYEDDLREEMETHRSLRQDALERDGLGPADAFAVSRRAIGNIPLAIEDARDVWALRLVDQMRQDLRDAIRGLHKSPGFTCVIIATLALGIGANTALFSIFNSLIVRPLPVRDPGSLALLNDGSWSYPVWKEIEARAGQMFDGAFAWADQSFDLTQGDRPLRADGAYVSGRFFDVLGLSPFRGRMLTPADDSPSAPDGLVAVISHRFWHEYFGGADDVVGRQISVLVQRHRFPTTIVGVMPPGFSGVEVGRRADVLMPFLAEPVLQGPDSALTQVSRSWLDIIVRREPDQTIEQASAALRSVQAQIRAAVVPDMQRRNPAFAARYMTDPLTFTPAAAGASGLRRQFATPLFAMVVAVGLVLLVACANIASLLLARALARREELSVRLALGAARWRLGRLLFLESLLVAAIGAAVGLLIATWGSALLVRQLDTWETTVSLDLALDWRVLAFTAALAGLCAIAAGLAPMFAVKDVAPGDALKSAGRAMTGDRRFAVRGGLVVAQIAVSFVLVVAAGLFLRTFASLSQLPLGFTPEPLVVVDVDMFGSGIPAEERNAAVDRLRDAAAVPGVTTVSASQRRLLTGGGWFTNNMVAIGDGPMLPEDRSRRVWRNAITPGYFETMGIGLGVGRDFSERDRVGSPPVAIVNEAFVRRYLPDQQPIGQTVRLDSLDGPRYEIVGVAADAVYTTPRDGMLPTFYVPIAQRTPREWNPWRNVVLTIKAAPGQRAMVERDVAAALTRSEPTLMFKSTTFDDIVVATRTEERLVAMMSGFFGGLALLLAGLGLYGIVAQAVNARRSEIGLRIALGAQPAGILQLVFRRLGVLIVTGLVLGLAGSWWAARFVAPLLFRVNTSDPMTFGGTAALLIAVGIAAAWLPATRAAHLDPANVLREG
jgi:putative ABC transport system permease protein